MTDHNIVRMVHAIEERISGGGAADMNSGGGVQASVDGTFLGDEILKPFETPFEPAAAYEFLKEFHEKYVIKKGDTVVVVMTGSGFYIAGRAVAG